MRGKPHPRDPAEASHSGSQELAQLSAGWEEGSTLVMLNRQVRPVCPSLTDGKSGKQKREDHGK